MRVSVIVPAYNAAADLREALVSVATQTHQPHELIVVDDASSDQTAAIARKVLNEFAFQTQLVLRPSIPDQFAGAARNAGAASAQGDILAFLDSDDIWEPHHLASAVRVFRTEPSVVAYCATGTRFDHRGDLGPMPETGFPFHGSSSAQDPLSHTMFVPNQTLCVRRAAFQKVRGYHPSLRCYEDWWLAIHLASLGEFHLDPVSGCRIRVRSGSLSRSCAGNRLTMSKSMYTDRLRLATYLRQSETWPPSQLRVFRAHSIQAASAGLFDLVRSRHFTPARDLFLDFWHHRRDTLSSLLPILLSLATRCGTAACRKLLQQNKKR